MLLKKDESLVLLVDVQKKLTPHIQNVALLLDTCKKTLQLAGELNIPIMISEQYPKGLGDTLPILLSVCTPFSIRSKMAFSCFKDKSMKEQIVRQKKSQLILTGIETHVCILQTAMDFLDAGYQIFIVIDAVGSRSSTDHYFALKRLKQAGCVLVTFEMLFFEWIETASHIQFKALSQAFLARNNP